MRHNTAVNTSSKASKGSVTAAALEQRAWQLVKQGEHRQALACCRHLNQQHADYTPGWYTTSQIAARLNQPLLALEAVEQALRLAPNAVSFQLQRAYCLMRLGRNQAARPLVERLHKAALTTAYQHTTLAFLMSRLDLQATALEHYQQAVRLEPEVGEHYYNLATVHRFLGNIEAAEVALTEALARDPGDAEAHKLRADLRQQTPEHNHLPELEAALAQSGLSPRQEAILCHALAKELEDLEQWQRSFDYLKRGADRRRALMRYDVNDDLDTMATIAEVYHRQFMADVPAGHDSEEPIFVVGLPRTGTTLVERVLGMHSRVHAAGELNNFALLMSRAVAQLPGAQGKLSKQQRVALSASLDFARLGEDYIGSTRPDTGRLPHFVDKMPLNFLYLGLIHRALPRARIVHLRRHPMDTCYAIYKTLFADAYPFSYSLEELGQYYLAYDRLMAHWESVLPGVIHTVYYEQLVADFEPRCRALLDYCGLPWEDQCLAFYRNQAASTTASASQVREPVHTRSVGKWRRFETQLQPLATLLAEAGVKLD